MPHRIREIEPDSNENEALGGVMAMNLLKRSKRWYRSKLQRLRDSYSTPSFSQCGEDVIVDYLFRLRGMDQPSYIDIGANHPFVLSNTARFHQRGCRGVNVDPNPNAIRLFNKHRRSDINLNVGIGDRSGESDFFVMEDHTLSTFSASERDYLESHGQRTAGVEKVQIMTLPEVIDRYCGGEFPDFMSLDVEGLELPILSTIDFDNCFPKVICIEIAEYSPVGAGARRTDLFDFLLGKHYCEYAHTNLNAIMVREQFWFGSV
jgi:FkbM family methyltransferase